MWKPVALSLGLLGVVGSQSRVLAAPVGELASIQLVVLVNRVAPRQEPPKPVAPGIAVRPSLRIPSSLFKTGDPGPAAPTPQQPVIQGQVPTPRPVQTRQTSVQFQPAPWPKVIYYGLQLTFYEHVMRLATQDFTRSQLEGKFWPDYAASVNVPETWHDKDGWEVNYLGHAIHGGAFTRIWLDQRERTAKTKGEYLKSIGRAFIYTTAFSIQYEIGPMSEASIGNVGMNPDDVGWVDLVWTPVGAVLWTIGEDAIDKYVLTFIDKHVPFMMAKAAARMILNPSRMLANVAENRTPWNRSDRTLSGERR